MMKLSHLVRVMVLALALLIVQPVAALADANSQQPTPISTPTNLTPPKPATTFGSKIWAQLKSAGTKGGYTTQDVNGQSTLERTITGLLQVFMGILGTAAVILLIYAGYLWMTAGGNEDQVAKAKTIIKQVVGGIIVVMLAYGIVAFAIYTILGLSSGGPGTEQQ